MRIKPVRNSLLWMILFLYACGESSDSGGGPAGIAKVPRGRTIVVGDVEMPDYASVNMYMPGFDYLSNIFIYEPLYFYNAFTETDNIIPWLATGHEYNDDFTEVTIHLREGIEWTDGVPYTAADIVFTIDMLKAHVPELNFSVDMELWVEEAKAPDDHTVLISLTKPNPRFVFTYFTYNFGNGVPVVPKHIWEGQDPTTFTNLDWEKGWPVGTGPYKLVITTPQQRVWDRIDRWWAAETGFRDMPKVERIIYVPGEEAKWVQGFLNNDFDTCMAPLPSSTKTILDNNPNISTWSGRDPPYGYLDYWPISIGFNCLEPPYDDPDIRWAINHALDRQQVVDIGWQGAGDFTLLPFPDYPPLRHFTSLIGDLLEEYPVGRHDPEKSAEIMTEKGYVRDEEGFWSRDGERFKLVLDISPLYQDIIPVMIQQWRRAGFDASYRMTADNYTRMTQGTAKAYLWGNGGSVRDPFFTLRLYTTQYVKPTGEHAEHFWRWSNPEFDALVDQMGNTAHDDPRLETLFAQAMEIWLRELPAPPLVQLYHRLPQNETYWKNWPTAENPYIHTAYWHSTWLLVLLGLEPVS